MKNLTLKNIIAETGGTYYGDKTLLEREVGGITTDSRAASEGCLFAAIVGERVDGHDYVAQTFEKGALCALCEKKIESDGNIIVVDSTLAALQKIAAFYRRQFSIPFIGITGSVGKTTAKEMIACVLSQRFNVHKTAGNFNNELGVPLTLFGLREEHTAAVIEMGISDFGEMRRLTKMAAPDCAVFTLIGCAHLEFLGDRPGVLRAKGEIVESMPSDGIIVANGDDDLLAVHDFGLRKVTFGKCEMCDVRAENVAASANGTKCDIVIGNRRIACEIPVFGEHIVYAALMAAAVGSQYGLSDEEIANGISLYEPVGSRGRVIEEGGIRIIDDCYNANPTSVASAISSLAGLEGRKIAILGDMLELGEDSDKMHFQTGALALEKGIDLVVATGDMSRKTALGAHGIHYETKEELIAALPEIICKGDSILVKASNSCRFGEIVTALTQLDTNRKS